MCAVGHKRGIVYRLFVDVKYSGSLLFAVL